MHRLQEVVRLHRQGESDRRIAKMTKMGRDTIRSYLSPSGLLEGSPDDLPSTSELSSALDSQSAPQSSAEARPSTVEQWREQIVGFGQERRGAHSNPRIPSPS